MSFLSQLLEYYHLTIKDLGVRNQPGSFASLQTPYDNADFLRLVHRINVAIAAKEKTVIYGDYDVDGITATTIMKRVLDEKGLFPGYFVPSRYHEGYGLASSRVKDFYEKGYHLIITVDNGVSCMESIRYAKSLGMDVLVIDHHEIPQELPPFDAIFHQTLSSFLSYNCSAASLCFFVSSYLRGSFDPYDAVLVGLAVFSDVMPLTGNNLILAKIMLSTLQERKYPNLLFLLNSEVSYHNLSFRVIPSLNSPGRISKEILATNHVVQFLLDPMLSEKTRKLGLEILSSNETRKKAVAMQKLTMPFVSEHSQTYLSDSCSGLSGAVCNHLMMGNNLPTAVFSLLERDPEFLVGSIRVPPFYDALAFIEKNRKLFVDFGGHPQACGVTIRKKDYVRFATEFASYFSAATPAFDDTKEAIPLVLEDLSEANYKIYQSFEPFGEGFREPRFSLTVSREDLLFSKSGTSVCTKPNSNGGRLLCFQNLMELKESSAPYYVFEGAFRKNCFGGKNYYELLADKVDFSAH